ncbi:MAG TPA: hypothetical protein VFZ73_12045, partial [Gemmatimonadaceae bacterium]
PRVQRISKPRSTRRRDGDLPACEPEHGARGSEAERRPDEHQSHRRRPSYSVTAELYLKVGDQLLTQANIPMGQQIDSVKPGVISLAKALVAKVR